MPAACPAAEDPFAPDERDAEAITDAPAADVSVPASPLAPNSPLGTPTGSPLREGYREDVEDGTKPFKEPSTALRGSRAGAISEGEEEDEEEPLEAEHDVGEDAEDTEMREAADAQPEDAHSSADEPRIDNSDVAWADGEDGEADAHTEREPDAGSEPAEEDREPAEEGSRDEESERIHATASAEAGAQDGKELDRAGEEVSNVVLGTRKLEIDWEAPPGMPQHIATARRIYRCITSGGGRATEKEMCLAIASEPKNTEVCKVLRGLLREVLLVREGRGGINNPFSYRAVGDEPPDGELQRVFYGGKAPRPLVIPDRSQDGSPGPRPNPSPTAAATAAAAAKRKREREERERRARETEGGADESSDAGEERAPPSRRLPLSSPRNGRRAEGEPPQPPGEAPRVTNGLMEVPLRLVNQFIVCLLCAGVYREPHTVGECMHTFCKVCILEYVRRMEAPRCPLCDVDLSRLPAYSIRPDRVLESLVDKLMPELKQREAEERARFCAERGTDPEADADNPVFVIRQRAATAFGGGKNDPAQQRKARAAAAAAAEAGEASAARQREEPRREERPVVFTLRPDESANARAAEGRRLGRLEKPFLRASASITVQHLKKYLALALDIEDPNRVEVACAGAALAAETSVEFVRRTVWRGRATCLELTYRSAHDLPYR